MLKLTADKHEASRGLSATAELLVNAKLEPLSFVRLYCSNQQFGAFDHTFDP